MVERRRHELLDATRSSRAPRASIVRAAAAAVVAAFVASAAVGLGIVVDAGVGAMISPAFAAIETGRPVRHRASIERAHRDTARRVVRVAGRAIAMGSSSRRVSKRVAIAVHHRAIAQGRRRDPAANSTPQALLSPSPSPAPSSPIVASAWRLTADGTWTSIVSMPSQAGDDPATSGVTFSSDTADVIPLDAHAAGAPGAIVTIAKGGAPVDILATPAGGSGVSGTLPAPPDDVASFAAVAEVVGPHLIDVGWTQVAGSAGVSEYKIYRRAAGESRGTLIGAVSPSGHTWHDASVSPTTAYTYTVVAGTAGATLGASTAFVATPPIMQPTSISAISGKGMFLYFSPDPAESNGYAHYDPVAVIARAKAAGISHIELRMARGTFFEAGTSDAKQWLDAFVDKAASAGIALIAWQVPRRATTDDAAEAVAIARYRSEAGNGFAGLSLDIEPGDAYMGDGATAKQRMVDQIQMVRQAVGPDYLIVATVMSPKLTHWTNARYPYDRIAPYASVMQPMEYWHHFHSESHHEYTQDEVASACADSVTMTQDLAGRAIPVNVAGQSDDLGTTGPPSADEIGWCLAASKSAGAVGQTFFDWRGTPDGSWAAITGFNW